MADKKNKEKKENPKNAGRKDYYTERIKPRLNEIKEWYSIGVSEEQVIKNLGIGRTTYYKYKKSEPELQETIKAGVIPVVVAVRSALLKSALGFSYTETKTYIGYPDKNGNRKTRKEITETVVPPNVTACMAWLNNRKPEQWKWDLYIRYSGWLFLSL